MATTRANTRVCLRKSSYEDYILNNPTLYDGEISLVYLPDFQRICLAIGDGETPFRDLTLYNLEPLKEKIIPTTYDLYKTTTAEATGKALKAMSERLAAHENLNQISQSVAACGITMAEAMENLKQAWQTLGSNVQTAKTEDLVGKRNTSESINIVEEKEEEPKTELSNSIEEFRNYINNLN